jgi:catechol 2,3-dioxygenase-like lactoylglutathione lyase family enzyme
MTTSRDDQPTVFGLSHIDLPVTNLERSLALYAGVLHFGEKGRGDGWADLDAGGCTLRLVVTRRPEHLGAIRVQAPAVDEVVSALIRRGARLVQATLRTPEQTLLAAVRDPDGNNVYVWRPLSEDEYDRVPELPTSLSWQPEAEQLLKNLLLRVPALFRGLARRRVTSVAEELIGPTMQVTREEVIRGFILASPRITRPRNRQPLLDLGIDVDRYQADWDAD